MDVTVKEDSELLQQLVKSTISTKFSSRWNDQMVQMAIQAVLTVANQDGDGDSGTQQKDTMITSTHTVVDLKRYAKVEKIPGGAMEDSGVVRGVMFQKDTVHPTMRRRIVQPRILLLDCPLEYKKGESQTNMEINNEHDWNALLELEEQYVAHLCQQIIAHRPDIVITEKGVSDLAQHYLHKANITAFRRLRKTDNNRIARAVGATIVSRPEDILDSDIGVGCGLFEMRQVGAEPFCYLTDCTQPTACTIVLRGGSKDVLNEMERNLQDALQVVRNVVTQPKLVPGGGAVEMAVAVGLQQYGSQLQGIQQPPFLAVAEALEAIPRTLAQNCGVSVIRTITQLRAKHATEGGSTWGINGVTGELVDMKEYGVWEPLAVKQQTIKTAIESACMILRIDDIVSGGKKQ